MQPRKIARPRTYIMYMFGTLYQAYIYLAIHSRGGSTRTKVKE